ncbi:MAG: hypothetical protein SWO11_15290 [Thermodesulfobacteriota bacterium]|nr:hypothetical protein [Thermodesulfobacteriota bacterium]
MRIRKTMVVGLLVYGLCVGTVSGITNISQFPLMKRLKPSQHENRKIASFVLDEDIFAAVDDEYSNLRIFDDKERETPFLVRCKKQTKTVVREYRVPVKTIAVKPLSDNRIEVIVQKEDKEAKSLAEVIALYTRVKNYEKQVTVYGGYDRTSWELIAKDRPIFDYTKYIDVRNNRVEIKPGPYEYYKIEISNISESQQSPLTRIVREMRGGALFKKVEKTSFKKEDFRIEKIVFFEKKQSLLRQERVMRLYSVNSFIAANEPEKQETIVTFDTFRTPVRELKILTEVPNFSRSLFIEGSDEEKDEKEWHPITSATISCINAGEFEQDRSTIKLGSPYRYRHYRITIRNFDSPPLEISGVEARGETHEVLFFPNPIRAYRALYGMEEARPPAYDIGAVLKHAEAADTDVYFPDEQEKNPSYSPPGRSSLFKGQGLLVPALILMVITLIWLILRSVKRLDS